MCVGFPTLLHGQSLSYNRDVRPILSNRCFKCHGPDKNKVEAGLQLESREVATHPLDSGSVAIVPGRPAESQLLARITDPDEELRMPPNNFGARLSEKEIQTLQTWIEQGADYEPHWSYVQPVRPAVPDTGAEFATWPINPIDQFVLAKMREQGLQPSPMADGTALARRVFLDLTGLPPTVQEVEAFLSDTDPRAYERLVDGLLQRPMFGEHWARQWLDLARYADSAGYADDPPRTIWAYRDWVIRALNDNMPFDRFTIEQLAGDLLPQPTDDQLIATAFHRNTQTNNEGGTNDEEFRNVAVVDRVNTTMAVWMGTTMACAQCHHHKYDPISQEDYFRVFAILNNTEDADLGDDSPRLPLFDNQQKEQVRDLESHIAALELVIDTPTVDLAPSQHRWEASLSGFPVWDVVKPFSITCASGGQVEPQDDQSLLIPTAAEKDTYSIDFRISPESAAASAAEISAIRLETLPHQSLPDQGSGHGGGNFVITQVKAEWVPVDAQSQPVRFVRVSIPGQQKILSLAEVQVFVGGENIASRGVATQSSVESSGSPELAVDGNTGGKFTDKSVTHTAISDDPWWEIDLQSLQNVERFVIWNRTDDGVQQRLSDFEVSLLDENRNPVWQQQVHEVPNPSLEMAPSRVRNVEFAAAVADYQQDKFPAASVLDRKADGTIGWAIGGATQQPHHLVLALAEPLKIQEAGVLRIKIEQNSIHTNHVLGRFRLSLTSDRSTIARAKLPPKLLEMVERPADQRDSNQQSELAKYFREQVADELVVPRAQLIAAKKQLSEIQPSTSVLVLRERQAERRVTHLQFRGNYLDLGPEMQPGVPAALGAISDNDSVNRLALAQWLVNNTNPLTPRVLVNRYWETIFGRGLVVSSEDFGLQGDLPTHPELLDWLAVEMIESGWDVKALLKLIVISATYRQAARVSPELAASDVENRWLSRGPRVRLSAESVRDQALFVSGLLSPKMFGPPVRPPQPNFGLTAAFGGSTDWETSEGDDRYRRAIYTTWRRSNPYPSMSTFDAPSREICTVRRNHTNTPLQSLVTLNDPVYVEAAQALARWCLRLQGSPDEQIAGGFRRCLLRAPSAEELDSLVKLFAESQTRLESQPDFALRLAADPLGALPLDLDAVHAASMTVVANVLLNLDEMFLKR